MKRFLCILLVAMALVGLMTTVASAEEYAAVVSENGYGVRMREGPGKAYRVTAKFDVGTTVIVQQRGSEWSQIKVGETVGWMMNEFLRFGETGTGGSGSSSTGGVGTGTVVSDNGLRVWLRATAGGKRISLYRPGTAVTILAYGDTWHHVSIGGVRGYMMSKYISVTPAPQPSSKAIEAVSVNYPAPVVDDVLQAVVTPSDATVTYSWKVGGVEQGKTASLRMLNEYIGKPITLTVTGTGVYYGSKSYTTDPVASSRRVTEVALSKAQPLVGDTLSAVLKPSSATVAYSWRVGGVEVSTEATYTVQESDIGKLIQLKVSGIEAFGGVAICSASGEVRSATEVFSVDLSIKNRPVMVGEVLSSVVTPSNASVSCVWTADGDVVSNTASYKVTANDLGKKIGLKVTGIAPYTGTATASAYGLVQSANITAVTLNTANLTAGDACYATLTPAGATATYQWIMTNPTTGAETTFAEGSYIIVPESAIGHSIRVRVRGAGIYGVSTFNAESGVDYIDSARTNLVASNRRVTAVALNNTSPVAGETVTAVLTPNALNSKRGSGEISYVWTVGTEIHTDTTGTYTALGTDVGKTITVKAITGAPHAGEAISAPTNPVRAAGSVAGVAIINDRTKANAAQVSPEVGDTLVASLNPWTAASVDGWIKYSWWIGSTRLGDGATLAIKPEWNGQQITLIADVTPGTPYYNAGKKQEEAPNRHAATTAKVALYAAVNADIWITAPVPGAAPQTAVSGTGPKDGKTIEVCNGSITWIDKATGALAVMDSKGHFKPETTYIARLTLNSTAGLSWNNAAVRVNGSAATQLSKAGNVFDFEFGATNQLPITQFYISGVPRPVPGGSPSVSSYSTDQYTAAIDWSSCLDATKTFKNAASYTVPITITPNKGYTAAGIAPNVFKVSTADATVSTAGSDAGITVTATFNVDHTVTVTAERTTINVDGVNVAVVQCFAKVGNATVQPAFKWSVQYKQSDSTWIHEDTGVLNVGPDEVLDKDIVVWATCSIGDKEYKGSLALHLVSGTQEDTAIKPVFNGNQPTSVLAGTTAQYSAYATNSVMGVDWAIEGNTSNGTDISDDGLLTVAADETAPSINVVVWPRQAPGERVKTNVSIIRTYTVTYTDGQGGALFSDVVYRSLKTGDATPEYNEANVPSVPGWTFTGWSPVWSANVGAENVVYIAQWETSNITPNMLINTLELTEDDLVPEQEPEQSGVTVTVTNGVDGAVLGQTTVQTIMEAYGYLETVAAPVHPTDPAITFAGWSDFDYNEEKAVVTFKALWTGGEQETPADEPTDVPADEPTDVPADEPTDVPADEPTDVPADEPTDVPADEPTDVPADEPADVPADEPTDVPADEPADVPADEPTDVPADEPADVPADEPTDVPADEPTDVPADEPADVPADEPVTYTVTYTNGKGEQLASYQVEEGAPTPACDKPAGDKAVCTGWSPAVADTVTADVTYEAQWADDWNSNGVPDTEDPKHRVVYKDGDTVLKEFAEQLTGMPTPGCGAPEAEGKQFEGWSPAVADTVTADATYVAQWSEVKAEEEPKAEEPAKDEAEPQDEEEPDDETLEKEYEAQAEASKIRISFEKGAAKIGRGKSSTYTVKVTGVPEGVQAEISWRLSGKDLTDTSAGKAGEGFKVTVGGEETAETLRVVVTVKVGDISVSRGRRVGIVAPEQADKEPEETVKDNDAEKDDPAAGQQPEETDEPEQADKPQDTTEDQMGQDAMNEGNVDLEDPASSLF